MVFLAFAVLAMAVLTLLLLRTLRALTRARQAEGRALTLLEERDRESRIRAEAEQRVKQVVEAARNGILLLSARRGSDGDVAGLEVVLANASAARIANTDRDRLVGGLLRDVLPALAVPALRAQWLHVLEEGYTSIAEVQADLGTGPGRYELRAERVQDGLLLTIRDLDEPGRRGPEEGSE
ncbi:MAG: PAS domain-containing protein, partial [Flavobacteriales bacterium]|nr:PAS domain-containing protein [Flavobacteriales bacterium]